MKLSCVKVGEVSSLNADIQSESNAAEVRLIARLVLEPSLIGLPQGAGEVELLDFLEQAVEGGLHARLASAGLFSSELIVELVTLDAAEPASFHHSAEPYPELPSAPSDLPDFTAAAEGALERISELPVEEPMAQAIATLASVENLASAESTRQAPAAAAALLEDTRALVADPEIRALPGELRTVVGDLRAILAELQKGSAVANLTAALGQGSLAAANLAAVSDELPALVDDFRAVAAKANALEAEELISSASQLVNSADALIRTEEALALLAALTGALDEMRSTLATLRQGGLVDNANATMASARGAADAVAAATERLPALSAPGEKVANLRSRTVEVRLISLPSYAAASDIVAEGEGGALFALGGAQWADDPARGMTAALARGLNERTGASAAIEPWPLNTGPDARLDVRVDQVYARSDGIFEFTGQFAVSSPEGTVREFVSRFDIRKPVNGTGPSATAEALARALAELARQVSLSM